MHVSSSFIGDLPVNGSFRLDKHNATKVVLSRSHLLSILLYEEDDHQLLVGRNLVSYG
jgi:hypothetical protein